MQIDLKVIVYPGIAISLKYVIRRKCAARDTKKNGIAVIFLEDKTSMEKHSHVLLRGSTKMIYDKSM